jgi:hypothetical protein
VVGIRSPVAETLKRIFSRTECGPENGGANWSAVRNAVLYLMDSKKCFGIIRAALSLSKSVDDFPHNPKVGGAIRHVADLLGALRVLGLVKVIEGPISNAVQIPRPNRERPRVQDINLRLRGRAIVHHQNMQRFTSGLSSKILTSRNQMPLDEGTDSQPRSICNFPRIRAP